MRLVLPRLYVILDATLLTIPEMDCAKNLVDAGVRLMQYRNKNASTRQLFESFPRACLTFESRRVNFIVNDRADVAALAMLMVCTLGRTIWAWSKRARWLVRKMGGRLDAQRRSNSLAPEHFGGLHCGRTDFCHRIERKSRSGGRNWNLMRAMRAVLGEAHCGHWRDHAGARSGSDRGRSRFGGGHQRYSARRNPGKRAQQYLDLLGETEQGISPERQMPDTALDEPPPAVRRSAAPSSDGRLRSRHRTCSTER